MKTKKSKKFPLGTIGYARNNRNITVVNKAVNISLGIYIVLLIDLIVSRDTNILGLIDSLSNVGNIYKSYLSIDDTNVSPLMQFVTLFSVVPFIAMCGGMYYYGNDKLNKKLFLSFAFINILEEVLRNGQFVTIANWFLIFIIVFFIKYTLNSGNSLLFNEIKKWKKKVIVISIILLSTFAYIQNSRKAAYEVNESVIRTEFFYANTSHLLYQVFPTNISDAISSFVYYVSGGYYGLGKNLETPFQWTYGYGNSKGLSSYLNQYLKMEDMFYYTYPMRTEERTGYPHGMYWCTVFGWLAGDLTFWGIPVFMVLFAMFYFKLYEKMVIMDDLWSIILFIRLTIFILYIPATNILMQTRNNTVITICLLFLYVLQSNSLNKYIKRN
ncbi:hypothetical protein [Bacteroides sp.]